MPSIAYFFHVQRLPAALYRVIKYIFENRTNGADACNVRVYRMQCARHLGLLYYMRVLYFSNSIIEQIDETVL